jgi:hypothetical protein
LQGRPLQRLRTADRAEKTCRQWKRNCNTECWDFNLACAALQNLHLCTVMPTAEHGIASLALVDEPGIAQDTANLLG